MQACSASTQSHLSCTQEEASSISDGITCDTVIWLCKGCHWCCCCRRCCPCCCWSWSCWICWTIFALALLANGTNTLATIVRVIAINLVPCPADSQFGQNCTSAPICTINLSGSPIGYVGNPIVRRPKPLFSVFTFTFSEGEPEPPGPSETHIVQNLCNILQMLLPVLAARFHQVSAHIKAGSFGLLRGKIFLFCERNDTAKSRSTVQPSVWANVGCWWCCYCCLGWFKSGTVISFALTHSLDWFGLSIGLIFFAEAGNILPDELAVVANGH